MLIIKHLQVFAMTPLLIDAYYIIIHLLTLTLLCIFIYFFLQFIFLNLQHFKDSFVSNHILIYSFHDDNLHLIFTKYRVVLKIFALNSITFAIFLQLKFLKSMN